MRCQGPEAIAQINAGDSYVLDVPSETLRPLVETGRLHATTDLSAPGKLDTVNICVVLYKNSTKPFGFMPFRPALGLGGHCIPINPFYLSWTTRQAGRRWPARGRPSVRWKRTHSPPPGPYTS
jgi:UDP-N-acetyl-D-mannosaminuronate dehydrogenase